MTDSLTVPCLLVVWHSLTGATQAAVAALAEAAREHVLVRVLHASAATAVDVRQCAALVLATPETLGSISGLMKDFLDRSYYPLLGHCPGLPVGLMVVAGSDGEPTLQQLRRVVAGLRFREVCAPLRICTHAQTAAAIHGGKTLPAEDLQAARTFGATLAAGLAEGVF